MFQIFFGMADTRSRIHRKQEWRHHRGGGLEQDVDGEGGQARVGANNAQLVVVTFKTLGKII